MYYPNAVDGTYQVVLYFKNVVVFNGTYVLYRFRNSVKNVQTLPGADVDYDHNLLVTKIFIS